MKTNRSLFATILLGLLALLTLPVHAVTQRVLPSQEKLKHGADLAVELTYADLATLTATNSTKTIELFSATTQVAVQLVKCVLDVPFQDASDAAFNSLLLEVGDGGDTDRLLTSTQVNVNGTEVLLKLGQSAYVYTSSDTVDVLLTPQAAKIGSNLDVGKLTLYFRIHDHR